MMIKASNGQCPLVDEPAKIVARLNGLKKGELYTYHVGNTAADASNDAELRGIIAEVQTLIEDTYRTPPKVIGRLRKLSLH